MGNYFSQDQNKCKSCNMPVRNKVQCSVCGGWFCRNNPDCGGVIYPYMTKNLDQWYQTSIDSPRYFCNDDMPPAFRARTASKISVDQYHDILFSEIFRDLDE